MLILLPQNINESTKKAAINLPREDLANIIGTARESLGRLLKEFKEEQLIRVQKRTIEIAEMEKLTRIANSIYTNEK